MSVFITHVLILFMFAWWWTLLLAPVLIFYCKFVTSVKISSGEGRSQYFWNNRDRVRVQTLHSFGKPSSKLKSHLMFIWKCSSESCLNLQPDSVSGCCLRLEQKWSITYSRLWEVWITMAKNRSFGVSLGQRVKAAMAAQGDTSRKTKIQDPSNMNLSSKGKEAQNLKPTAPPPEIAEKTEEKQLPVRSKTPCASAQGTLQRTRVLAIFIEKQWLQEFANFWWCCYFTFKQRQPK